MLISLHKQATTTPKIRAAIQASADPAWMVAGRYGISEQTVWKWRKRDRRHGVGNLRALKPKEAKPTHSSFKAYEPGYLHIDIKYLPQMADEDRRRYLFVAIDRATRWVFVRIYSTQTAANARRFLRDLARAAPMKITRVLTDNGKAFTDRLFGLHKRAATGQQEFDQLCTDLGIEQSRLFTITAHGYKRYVEKSEENKRNQIFKEILENNELEDTSTMLERSQVQYVCLPIPK